MRHHRALLGIIVIIVISSSSSMTLGHHGHQTTPDSGQTDTVQGQDTDALLAADPGVIVDWKPVIILELPGYIIPARGAAWSQMLQSEGLLSKVVTMSDVIADPTLIHAAQAILVDGSLGADNAGHVQTALVDILVGEDASVILTGQSAWLLHLLRDGGPPSGVVSSTTQLLATPGLEGAIYLSSPIPLTLGSSLTSEPAIDIPDDDVQTEMSRIIDLTGALASSVASLRYDSWPLDTFLIGLEDPTLLTTQGRGLVINTIAYAATLRENPVSQTLSTTQTPVDELLTGGYPYAHEATMDGTYYAVKIAKSLMTPGEWSIWRSAKEALVVSILNGLVIDYGAESGFLSAGIDGSVTSKSTAEGLWVLSVMESSSQFDVSAIVSYLSSRQDVDGGFENHITVTYHVTEALSVAGSLGSIDTGSLESWLYSCVIDGSKTSDPNLWGAIGSNPTSTSPTNHYASEYVQALAYLGATHNDPVKLTSWITTRTAIGDGSYRDTVGPGEEITIGTGSALTAMAMMGTLSPENHTSGMSWLSANQQETGGFGLKTLDEDIVAKSKESFCVSVALREMAETSSTVAVQLMNYLGQIETGLGFELMDPLPTMMWTYWLSTVSRMNHGSPVVNITLTEEYMDAFSQWTQYPFWSNITAVTAPEYGVNQYRAKSVWTQYFGAATADALGVAPSPIVVSDALNYISTSQFMTGHFRPAMFMGTAHIQYSVAAVEALYLLDSLDTIPYRSALESAMLADYSA
ncbi:MAG: prenyltransferase/squalene oxidase repeat-containing protein, partial [Candidatus Thorarchaeota archaeon]